MPLGFERLNERQQRPNALINFIKPLEGPDKATSEEFLSRIAAQCYPVMKKNHISVMALQEHAPNPEFLGRNFNAGEVIELVLKDKQGRWLSMKFVQMVMMHELAHCKQMNHSRYFWNVRNEYAQSMEELWRQGYSGEGMWGRGRGLDNGAFVSAAPPDNSQIPEHLCGGSYRRRGRKRKRGEQSGEPEKVSYAERQQRRIARKFGKHGDGASLGEDDLLRGALETMSGGKRAQGKPRVANSKRGRELRAAAALARFDQAKHTPPPEPEELDSETDSDWEDEVSVVGERAAVVISDGHGRDLVKVCGEGEDDEEGAGREMDELRMLSAQPKGRPVTSKRSKKPQRGQEGHDDSETEGEDEEAEAPTTKPQRRTQPAEKVRTVSHTVVDVDSATEDEDPINPQQRPQPSKTDNPISHTIDSETEDEDPTPVPIPKKTDDANTTIPADQLALLREIDVSNAASQTDEVAPVDEAIPSAPPTAPPDSLACQICSLENEANSPTCMACANVLRPKLMPNHWRCPSEACKGRKYVNAGDAGRCGLCGAQKPKAVVGIAASEGLAGGSGGFVRPEVLRWD